jgi:hypothetical protein
MATRSLTTKAGVFVTEGADLRFEALSFRSHPDRYASQPPETNPSLCIRVIVCAST